MILATKKFDGSLRIKHKLEIIAIGKQSQRKS